MTHSQQIRVGLVLAYGYMLGMGLVFTLAYIWLLPSTVGR